MDQAVRHEPPDFVPAAHAVRKGPAERLGALVGVVAVGLVGVVNIDLNASTPAGTPQRVTAENTRRRTEVSVCVRVHPPRAASQKQTTIEAKWMRTADNDTRATYGDLGDRHEDDENRWERKPRHQLALVRLNGVFREVADKDVDRCRCTAILVCPVAYQATHGRFVTRLHTGHGGVGARPRRRYAPRRQRVAGGVLGPKCPRVLADVWGSTPWVASSGKRT